MRCSVYTCSLILLAALHATAHAPGTPPSERSLAPDVAHSVDAATPSAVAPPVAVASAPADAAAQRPLLRADRVMVRAADLDAVAAAHGTSVVRAPGGAGVGALAVPDGVDPDALVAQLSTDPRVATAAREARFYGASGPPASMHWHMDAVDAPAPDTGLSSWVVAVLDTGVAYENYNDGTTQYAQASGMASVTVVDPLDLVENDGHPNDDHMHGTHIASIILSKANIPGVASGASLMPVKVLDDTNAGTELDLIDGIDHAVLEGADVINLSLSFPLGYLPSVELRQALSDAHDAGVVLVAAAGNDGEDEIAWPAAHPLVIAVGSSTPTATAADDIASYSNRGPGLDVLAPGGTLSVDHNSDGWGDGIAAQTIASGDPSTIAWYLYEGTSQATAMVSGTVVRLLDDGVAPDDVRARLQAGAFSASDAATYGSGVGPLDVPTVRAATDSDEVLSAGGMAFIRRYVTGSTVEHEPTVQVVVVDDAGNLVTSGDVLVQVEDDVGVSWASCSLNVDGLCEEDMGLFTVTTGAPDAWLYTVVGVVRGGVAHRPRRAVFTSDGTEIVMAAIDDAAVDSDRAIAVWWPQGNDPDLGQLSESFSITATGSDLGDAPVIGNFTRGHVTSLIDSETTVSLDVEGTGLMGTQPGGFGFMDAKELDLDGGGTGLLGSRTTKLLALDGSSYASGDLGWHAGHLFAAHDDVIAPATHGTLGLNGTSVPLDGSLPSGVSGTALGNWVDAGGSVASDGYEAARALSGAGTLDIGRLAAASDTSGNGESSLFVCYDDDC